MKVTAMVTRSGDWWAIRIPEVDGAFTQVKRLEQAAEAAAEAVADLLEVDAATVHVTVKRELDSALAALIESSALLSQAADEAWAKASAAKLRAVNALRQAGLSTRDVGELLDLSFQRVSQLEKSAPPAARQKVIVKPVATGSRTATGRQTSRRVKAK